ncbi:MAG: saccharopine dehydrogenase [Planctomycetes bacterium]|nr:saccharopine dehydrogenase [Planctomycetota bacterium]NOG53644.1 saccharopine dehydrogenase [Planctomycetota bacterium]
MKRHRVLVLGAGMIGNTIADDLSRSDRLEVTVADINKQVLHDMQVANPRLNVTRQNLTDPAAIRAMADEADIVVGALPSRMGRAALEAVIAAGTNYVDISFMSEDALELDDLARAGGVTAVTDCGVAPGLSNLLVGYAADQLAEVDEVRVYVGGLPVTRHWPYEYKAGFAPHDVIEEYTRPTRIIRNGSPVEVPALTEPETLEIEGLGSVTAFLTDGLRSLMQTIPATNMVEKTIRYPGHCELMAVLRHMGLFSSDTIAVGPDRTEVRPIDVTSALLFPQWTFTQHEEDLTIMRIHVSGRDGHGETRVFEWDLLDRYDQDSGTRSMSRCTAFPAAITAQLILDGRFERPGVCAPEMMAQNQDVFDHIMSELKQRGVVLTESH